MPEPSELPPTKTQSGPPDALPSAVGSGTVPTEGKPPVGLDPDSPRLRAPEHPGDLGRLGRYRVIRRLGVGGMGEVYLAFDQGLRRRAALKVMLPKFAVVPAARERFHREARKCAQIRNEHVVTIYDVGEDGGVPFIAMEYLQGYALDEYLKRHDNRLSVSQVLRVGREVCEGLAAAHALGQVHRDIKPANLWLEAPHGRVKILDFGLAKSVTPGDNEDDGHLTKTGAVVGTPAYMSPEQARGVAVDARTDLFSLGAVLYRLTTGRLPFTGATSMAILTSLAMDTPPSVQTLNAEVPDTLADLIHRLLAKDVAHRPASAKQVAAELLRIERGLAAGELSAGDPVPMATAVGDEPNVVYVPIQVTAYESPYDPGAFAGLDNPSALAGSEGSVTLPKGKSTKRGGRLAWVAAVATVILVGVLGAVVWRKVYSPKPASPSDEPPPVVVKGNPPKPPTPGTGTGPSDATFFNGRNLDGWNYNPGVWRVDKPGEIVATIDRGSPHDEGLSSPKRYRDFELRFDVQVKGEYGVILFRGTKEGPNIVGALGLTLDNGGKVELWKRDILLRQSSPQAVSAARPQDFNTVLLRCVRRHVTVEVNGVWAISGEFELPAEGVIAWVLPKTPGGRELRLRNIRFTDLGKPVAPGPWRPALGTTEDELKPHWVEPGKTFQFTCDKSTGGPVWTGVATGAGSVMLADKQYHKDFHFRLDYRTPAKISWFTLWYFNQFLENGESDAFSLPVQPDGTVQVKVQPQLNLRADAAVIRGGQVVPVANGSSLGPDRTMIVLPGKPRPPGEWNTLELIVLGDTAVHRLNGEVIGVFANHRKIRPDGSASVRDDGQLALSLVGDAIEFRRIEIREITAIPPEVTAAHDSKGVNEVPKEQSNPK